jgi:anti-anti-sigma factor
MAQVEVSSGNVPRGGPPAFWGGDADHSVVWVRGGHDASTVVALCMTLAGAIAVDDTDLVVDLSEVTFMDAATVEVMIRAETFLRDRSRSLTLRSPSTPARRALGGSGLADLVDPEAADTTDVTGTADLLAHRLAVPPTGRAAQRPERSGPPPRSAPGLRGCMTAPGGESSADSRHMIEKRTTSADGRRRP